MTNLLIAGLRIEYARQEMPRDKVYPQLIATEPVHTEYSLQSG